MKEKIIISECERELIETGEEYDFPKYVPTILNKAMNVARANGSHVVGQTSEIKKHFREEYPNGTYEDWVEFYNSEYDGEKRIEKSIEKTYKMLQNFKKVIGGIDESIVEDYIKEFIYYKTPQGFDDEKLIFEKLSEIYNKEYKRSTKEEEPGGIDGYLCDQPVSIKPMSYKREGNPYDIDVPIVYYEDFKSKDKLILDISELNDAFYNTKLSEID